MSGPSREPAEGHWMTLSSLSGLSASDWVQLKSSSENLLKPTDRDRLMWLLGFHPGPRALAARLGLLSRTLFEGWIDARQHLVEMPA
jgi:hypothetical protein